MIVQMLIGMIITFLVFVSFLFFIKAYGHTAVEPLPSKADMPPKTFPSLTFGNDHTVEAKVVFKDRAHDLGLTIFGYIFWALMLAQFVIGIVIVVMGNSQIVPNGDCPEGLVSLLGFSEADQAAAAEAGVELPDMNEMMPPGMPGYCVLDDFKLAYDECQAKAAEMEPGMGGLGGAGGMSGLGGLGGAGDCSMEQMQYDACITQVQEYTNQGVDQATIDLMMDQCQTMMDSLTQCQNNARRLQVGKPRQHGRILMERSSRGNVVATVQHDLFSALHMHQFRSMTGRPLRKLQEVADSASEGDIGSLWTAFEEYMQVPAVIFTCVIVAVPLWIFILKTCTAGVVWGTLSLNLIALIYAIIRPFIAQQQLADNLDEAGVDPDVLTGVDGMTIMDDSMTEPKPMTGTYMLIVIALGYIGLIAMMRKKIMTAIDIVKIATTGLSETPSILGASTVCFLLYATYIAFWEIAVISSSGVVQLTDMTHDPDEWLNPCKIGIPGYMNGMVQFLTICFVPTTFFFFNANMCCCATGLGAWYFHADDPQRPRSPAFVGLKWAFFDSTGPVFMASLIQYAVHEIKKLLNKRPNPCNPIWVIARIVWCFVQAMVEAFTKMMLLGHLFHGGGLISTCRNAYQVLKNHLGQVLVTEMVSEQVVNWSLIVFSVGFGVASCAWMDSVVGKGLFNGGVQGLSSIGVPADFIAILVCCLFLFFAKYPLFSLVVVIGFLQGLIAGLGGNAVIGLLTGIFFSAIVSIIFNFVGKIVHNCTDVIMYCLALEKETGKEQTERFENLYKVMKDQIQTGTTDAGAVAQGQEVAPPQMATAK